MMLIFCEADINSSDNDGNHPLHVSALNGHEEVGKIFHILFPLFLHPSLSFSPPSPLSPSLFLYVLPSLSFPHLPLSLLIDLV